MWKVKADPAFKREMEEYTDDVLIEITALTRLLSAFGPNLKRPHCDTLKGSKYRNMKELRFSIPSGTWRLAYAFDVERSAILLVGGSKSGKNEKRFYRDLIRIADERFKEHLTVLDRQGDMK
jgi:hypothetical protein